VVGSWLVAAEPLFDGTEVAQRSGLADGVAGLPEQDQGLLKQVGSLLVPALPQVDRAQAVQRLGFAGPVARLPGGAVGAWL
jgi:hypothetical protein